MLGTGSIEKSLRGLLTVLVLAFGARSARADLLLFYTFDDDSDPLVAVDESGQGNDGVIGGNDLDGDGFPDTPALYTDPGLGRTGAPNDRALDFLTTAEGTYLSVSNAAAGAFDSMTANDTATVTMWLFGSDLQPVNQWNMWFGPNRQLGAHVPWSDGTIYFDVAGCCDATQRLQQNEPDPSKYKGDWNHYAFVKEIDTTRIYQNGVLWAEGSGKAPLGFITEVFFGAGDSGHVANYNGLMDEIGVWDEALTEEDIQNVMENGVGPPRPISLHRDIPDTLVNGTSGVVKISVIVRIPGATVVINEKMPPGLTASAPTGGGNLAGDTITWNLGVVNSSVDLTYTMTASLDAMDGKLPSTATVNGSAAGIGGDTTYTGSFYTPNGFIRLWEHLGPLAFVNPSVAGDNGPPGSCDANGGIDLAKDWIVNDDETVTELNVMPFPGMLTRPSYGGDGAGLGARAAGLVVAPGDTGAVVTDRFPVWKAGQTRGDTIDHASAAVHGFDAEDHVTLSCVYVTNNTGAPIDTNLGIGSDDSIQIFLNDVDLTVGGIPICRAWGAANEEQNTVPVTLPTGESRLLVKVSDGCCQSGFRLRFQNPADPLGPGLLPPDIRVSLVPALRPIPATVVRDVAQASYSNGDKLDVSLAVTASPAANIRVREVLPEGASAESISDGGVLGGGAIQWDLTSVTTKTLTYKLAPGSCFLAATFGQSTWQIGSVEAVVTGEASVSRNPLADKPLGPWKSIDIGYTGGGAQALGAHDVLVDAQGGGIKLKEDQFRFIYTPASGDFVISAKIDCMDDAGVLGQAGLMVRDTLDVFSAHAYVALSSDTTTTSGVKLKGTFRRETNPARLSTSIIIPAAQQDVLGLPISLRLTRAGTKLTFERSEDGVTYEKVAEKDIGTTSTQVNLGTDTLVGLAITGSGGGTVGVTFRDVSGLAFTGNPEDCSTVGDEDGDGKADCADEDCASLPSCQQNIFHRGDADNNGELQLTDAIRVLGFLFLGQAAPTCLDAGDADDNGQIQLTDAIRILGFLFLGGPPPASPGPPGEACGPDPTAEDPELDCAEYNSCE